MVPHAGSTSSHALRGNFAPSCVHIPHTDAHLTFTQIGPASCQEQSFIDEKLGRFHAAPTHENEPWIDTKAFPVIAALHTKGRRLDCGKNKNTVDGQNIETLQTSNHLDPFHAKTIQTSMLASLPECFGEWTTQIKPWQHKFNQVVFKIDLWGSGVGDTY